LTLAAFGDEGHQIPELFLEALEKDVPLSYHSSSIDVPVFPIYVRRFIPHSQNNTESKFSVSAATDRRSYA